MMTSSFYAFVTFGLLLTFVQSNDQISVAEYEIKQGFLSGGRNYEITGKTNAIARFTIRNELFNIGKKLFLLQDGEERYIVKHDILHLMSTWIVTDAVSGRELGTIENKFRLTGSKIVAKGLFGHYTIIGDFGNHSFTITKSEHEVAKIEKKKFHLHDTYGLTIYGDTDQALMILFAVIVDEIREH